MMKNKYILKTERLVLSEPTEEDLKDIIMHAHDPIIAQNSLYIPYPYEEKDAYAWLEITKKGLEDANAYIFGIRLKESNQLIGGMGLHLDKAHDKAEVGYWLGKAFRRNGYTSEALKRVIRFGFDDLKLNKIYASHFINNPVSGKVMEKAGMCKEGILKHHYKKNGEYLDAVFYAIFPRDIG